MAPEILHNKGDGYDARLADVVGCRGGGGVALPDGALGGGRGRAHGACRAQAPRARSSQTLSR
jgi:hypothetical protein